MRCGVFGALSLGCAVVVVACVAGTGVGTDRSSGSLPGAVLSNEIHDSAGCTADACDATSGEGPDASATCAQAAQTFDSVVSATSGNGGDCRTKADCVLHAAIFRCDNASINIQDCDVAVNAATAANFETKIAELRARYCAAQCGIGGAATCEILVPECVAGVCRAVASD